MKLIFCPKCSDVIKLHFGNRFHPRKCFCGKSSGKYLENGVDAVLEGEAIPVGFINAWFYDAVKNQPEDGQGKKFIAFVIPKKCKTISYK